MSARRGGVAVWATGAALLAVAGAVTTAVVARGGAGPAAPTEVAASEGWPRVFRDADGRDTVIPARPTRIVSLTVAADEILFDLGAGDRVAAVTEIGADPAQSFVAEAAARVPPERRFAVSEGAAERVLGLRSDLVVTAPWTDASTLAHLRRAGVPVFRLGAARTLADIARDVRTLARAVGLDREGERLAAAFRARLGAVAERTAGAARVRVLSLSDVGAEMWTGGAATLLDEEIAAAGGVNVASAEAGVQGYSPVSMERLLALQPDAVVLSALSDGAEATLAAFRARPGAENLAAVRAGRVHALPARLLATTSHHAAEGVEALARVLHPEAFGGA